MSLTDIPAPLRDQFHAHLPAPTGFNEFMQLPCLSVVPVIYGKVTSIEPYDRGNNVYLCVGDQCMFKLNFFGNINTPPPNLPAGTNLAITLAVKS